ncbi:MAG: glycosyltransferase [Phycisphaerales bacterium]
MQAPSEAVTTSDFPLVSVVMPFRDSAETLDRAIRSMTAQTLRSWELLAIDDRSTDDGPHAIKAWRAADPRIRLLTSETPGLVAALQHGCNAACGEFIARFDADDECHPERLVRQVALLQARPEIGVVGSLVEFGGDPASAAGYAEHVAWTNSLLDHQAVVTNRFVDSPLPHPSVMFRRELLERFGGYREGPFPEDHELWLRWIDAGVRFAKVPEVLLRWNDPPDRLSRTDPRYSVEAIARLRCAHLAIDLARRGETRPLWLWGAGRVTRRRFDGLAERGVPIAGFIDIDPDRVGQRSLGVPIVGPDHLPSIETSFIVSGVGVRGAREEIRRTLLQSGRREGEDFLIAS